MDLLQELSKSSIKVSENLSENLTSIMAVADQRDIPTFYEVFLGRATEVYKMFIPRNLIPSNDNTICLSLAAKSASGMMILDMMKNLLLAFLSSQADITLGIMKTTSDQRVQQKHK